MYHDVDAGRGVCRFSGDKREPPVEEISPASCNCRVRLRRDEKPSQFIFYLVEPERPNIDRAMAEFVKRHVFDLPILSFAPTGVCRLNPEVGRMVVANGSA
jgi:hypothetical protein